MQSTPIQNHRASRTRKEKIRRLAQRDKAERQTTTSSKLRQHYTSKSRQNFNYVDKFDRQQRYITNNLSQQDSDDLADILRVFGKLPIATLNMVSGFVQYVVYDQILGKMKQFDFTDNSDWDSQYDPTQSQRPDFIPLVDWEMSHRDNVLPGVLLSIQERGQCWFVAPQQVNVLKRSILEAATINSGNNKNFNRSDSQWQTQSESQAQTLSEYIYQSLNILPSLPSNLSTSSSATNLAQTRRFYWIAKLAQLPKQVQVFDISDNHITVETAGGPGNENQNNNNLNQNEQNHCSESLDVNMSSDTKQQQLNTKTSIANVITGNVADTSLPLNLEGIQNKFDDSNKFVNESDNHTNTATCTNNSMLDTVTSSTTTSPSGITSYNSHRSTNNSQKSGNSLQKGANDYGNKNHTINKPSSVSTRKFYETLRFALRKIRTKNAQAQLLMAAMDTLFAARPLDPFQIVNVKDGEFQWGSTKSHEITNLLKSQSTSSHRHHDHHRLSKKNACDDLDRSGQDWDMRGDELDPPSFSKFNATPRGYDINHNINNDQKSSGSNPDSESDKDYDELKFARRKSKSRSKNSLFMNDMNMSIENNSGNDSGSSETRFSGSEPQKVAHSKFDSKFHNKFNDSVPEHDNHNDVNDNQCHVDPTSLSEVCRSERSGYAPSSLRGLSTIAQESPVDIVNWQTTPRTQVTVNDCDKDHDDDENQNQNLPLESEEYPICTPPLDVVVDEKTGNHSDINNLNFNQNLPGIVKQNSYQTPVTRNNRRQQGQGNIRKNDNEQQDSIDKKRNSISGSDNANLNKANDFSKQKTQRSNFKSKYSKNQDSHQLGDAPQNSFLNDDHHNHNQYRTRTVTSKTQGTSGKDKYQQMSARSPVSIMGQLLQQYLPSTISITGYGNVFGTHTQDNNSDSESDNDNINSNFRKSQQCYKGRQQKQQKMVDAARNQNKGSANYKPNNQLNLSETKQSIQSLDTSTRAGTFTSDSVTTKSKNKYDNNSESAAVTQGQQAQQSQQSEDSDSDLFDNTWLPQPIRAIIQHNDSEDSSSGADEFGLVPAEKIMQKEKRKKKRALKQIQVMGKYGNANNFNRIEDDDEEEEEENQIQAVKNDKQILSTQKESLNRNLNHNSKPKKLSKKIPLVVYPSDSDQENLDKDLDSNASEIWVSEKEDLLDQESDHIELSVNDLNEDTKKQKKQKTQNQVQEKTQIQVVDQDNVKDSHVQENNDEHYNESNNKWDNFNDDYYVNEGYYDDQHNGRTQDIDTVSSSDTRHGLSNHNKKFKNKNKKKQQCNYNSQNGAGNQSYQSQDSESLNDTVDGYFLGSKLKGKPNRKFHLEEFENTNCNNKNISYVDQSSIPITATDSIEIKDSKQQMQNQEQSQPVTQTQGHTTITHKKQYYPVTYSNTKYKSNNRNGPSKLSNQYFNNKSGNTSDVTTIKKPLQIGNRIQKDETSMKYTITDQQPVQVGRNSSSSARKFSPRSSAQKMYDLGNNFAGYNDNHIIDGSELGSESDSEDSSESDINFDKASDTTNRKLSNVIDKKSKGGKQRLLFSDDEK